MPLTPSTMSWARYLADDFDGDGRDISANVVRNLIAEVERLTDRDARVTAGYARDNEEICQTLGKALGYPWFEDNQENFPGATEADGVCVGEHVAASLAAEAVDRIASLVAQVERLERLACVLHHLAASEGVLHFLAYHDGRPPRPECLAEVHRLVALEVRP